MLTDTAASPAPEPSERIGRQILTLGLPSLWPECKWIVVVAWTVVEGKVVEVDLGAFFNWYSIQANIILCLAGE